MFKNNIYKFLILILFVSVFIGCGKSKYELMLEERKEKSIQFKKNQIKIWKNYGYTKNDFQNWSKYNFIYKYAKPWLDIGVTNPKEAFKYLSYDLKPYFIKPWIDNGFNKIEDIASWNNNGHNPYNAKAWYNLGIESIQVKDISYDDILKELKRQSISLEEYKLWLKFGLIQPDDITYFKSKKYTTKTLKNKNAKDILNNMDFDTFFEFMGIEKERLKNFYIVHWKFDTNFKRFRGIVHKYYSVE